METTHHKAAPIVRLASMALLIVPLALAALLLGAKVSHATPVPTPAFLSFEEEEEAEEEEIEREEEEWEEWELEEGLSEDECEAAGEEAEDGVLTYAEAAAFCTALEEEGGGEARAASSADRCALRSARGHAAARNKRLKLKRLKLTIGYTTHRPTKARVEIRVGRRRLATVKRRLGRSGVLRIAKRIGKKHRGKRIRIRIKALPAKGAGHYCAEEPKVLFRKSRMKSSMSPSRTR